MEKSIKIITRKLNAIGNLIGYPYYFYPDGSYGKDANQAVVKVSSPLGVTEIKDPQPQHASIAERYTQNLASAKALDYLYANGDISPKRLNQEITGIIGWKNPDKEAPVGKRALCFTFHGWKYDDFMSNQDFSQNNHFSLYDIQGTSGKQNSFQLQELAKKHQIDIIALNHCLNYAQNGLSKGDCFLPSQEELRLVEPVFLDLVNQIESFDFGSSERVRNKRFGTNITILKHFLFTSNLVAPNAILCFLYYPEQAQAKFYTKDFNDCACIAPVFWI